MSLTSSSSDSVHFWCARFCASVCRSSLTDLGSLTAEAQTAGAAPAARAFRSQRQPKPLPFDPAKSQGISEKLIRSHWEYNCVGSVNALNVDEQRLEKMSRESELPAYLYGDLKREELMRTGSDVLHQQYFDNLVGDGKAGGEDLETIKQWFGSYEQWEAELKKTANALSGGAGWAVLAYNLHTGEIHSYWQAGHLHNAPMNRPLLALDMYEHSCQME